MNEKEFIEFFINYLIEIYFLTHKSKPDMNHIKLWGRLGTSRNFPGITPIFDFFRRNDIKKIISFERTANPKFFEKIPSFKAIVSLYIDSEILENSCKVEEGRTFSDLLAMKEFRKIMEEKIDNKALEAELSAFVSSYIRPDERKVLSTLPFDEKLKRMNVLASFLCISNLSACAAISCFSNKVIITSNYTPSIDIRNTRKQNDNNIPKSNEEQTISDHIKKQIADRYKYFTKWCDAALKKDMTTATIDERRQIILQEIITLNELIACFQHTKIMKVEIPSDFTPEKYFSFELSGPVKRAGGQAFFEEQNSAERNLWYFTRFQLAKVVESVCFSLAFADSRDYFIRETPSIYLPIDLYNKTLNTELLPQEQRNKIEQTKDHLSSIHAELIQYIIGRLLPLSNKDSCEYDKRIGISKSCCSDCFEMANKFEFIVAGTHTGKFPNVLNLCDGSFASEASPTDIVQYHPEKLTRLKSPVTMFTPKFQRINTEKKPVFTTVMEFNNLCLLADSTPSTIGNDITPTCPDISLEASLCDTPMFRKSVVSVNNTSGATPIVNQVEENVFADFMSPLKK